MLLEQLKLNVFQAGNARQQPLRVDLARRGEDHEVELLLHFVDEVLQIWSEEHRVLERLATSAGFKLERVR